MSGETQVTVVGNLTADPELRYTQGGVAVASFTVAATPRKYAASSSAWIDGGPLFMRCSAWRDLAEHVAGSLTKGARVIVRGALAQRSFESKSGEKHTVIELTVDEIGPSLRYATATVTKTGGSAVRGSRDADGGYTGERVYGRQPGTQEDSGVPF